MIWMDTSNPNIKECPKCGAKAEYIYAKNYCYKCGADLQGDCMDCEHLAIDMQGDGGMYCKAKGGEYITEPERCERWRMR